MGVKIDDSSFKNNAKEFVQRMQLNIAKSVEDVAREVLRLSTFEVPHDTGMLQASGSTERQSDLSQIVGYNKVYAARLHEHPEYRFQKGRKGKFLEDPIKNNLNVLLDYIKNGLKQATQ